MFKKYLLGFLLILGLALPASAWEQSFELHPNDDDLSYMTADNFSLKTYTEIPTLLNPGGDGLFYYCYITEDIYQDIRIDRPFTDYFTFEFYTRSPASANIDIFLELYNGDGVNYSPTSDYLCSPVTTTTITKYKMEFVRTSTGLDVYANDVLVKSTTFVDPSEADGSGYMIVRFLNKNMPYAWIGVDNFIGSPDYALVSCDTELEDGENNQNYKVSFPYPDNRYMFTRVYAPNGTVIQTTNVSLWTQYSIPQTMITQDGTYSIKLFAHDTMTNSDIYYSSRYFIHNIPSSDSLTLNKDQYSPGEQMQIFTLIDNFVSGYTVSISYKTDTGLTAYTYNVPSDDYTKVWPLPSKSIAGTYFVYLKDPENNIVASDYYYLAAPLGEVSLTLDKQTYENNDSVKIFYAAMPEDTRIDFYLLSGSTKVYTTQWLTVSGSGVKTVPIAGKAADSIYVKATQGDIFEGTVLSDVTASILSGTGFITGKVYDSNTNVPVSGATVYIGGSEAITNTLGFYEMTALMGTQPVSITKDGYNQYTGNVQIYSISSTEKNFYLVPLHSSGSNTLYGTITDYYSGAPLSTAYIQIKNGSVSYSMLSHSKTGNYLFDQADLIGSWEITVTKTGFDTYTGIVSIEGDTYKSIKLAPVGGTSIDAEDTNTSSDTNDGISEITGPGERPGREAARESMEQFEAVIPGIIGFVILRILMELFV